MNDSGGASASALINLLIIAAVIGLLPAWIAHRKGHSFGGWWIFGALVFIIALPCALVLKPSRAGERQCPHCAEWIAGEAKVCKHCGRDLPGGAAAGWYAAPDGAGQRYWDGSRWTEHTSP